MPGRKLRSNRALQSQISFQGETATAARAALASRQWTTQARAERRDGAGAKLHGADLIRDAYCAIAGGCPSRLLPAVCVVS